MGGGTDTLDVSGTTGRAISINLSLTGAQTINANLRLTVRDSLVGEGEIENVIGGRLNDTIRGNSYENVLHGGLGDDVLRFGLNSVLSREANPDLVRELIKIRGLFYWQWGKTLAGVVEFIDPKQYLYQSSVLVNIVFGSPESPAYELKRLAGNALFRQFLEETELLETLLVLGRELARRTVRLLQDLRGDTFFFEASPIPEDQFDQYGELVEGLENLAMDELSQKDQDLLLRLALRFIPARHKMLALPASLEAKILQARGLFVEKIQIKDPEAFSFYCQVDYLYNNSILNNILEISLQSIEVVEKLHQIMLIHLEFLAQNKELYLKLMMETMQVSLESQKRIQVRRYAYQDLLSSIIKQGVQQDVFRPVDPLLVARLLINSIIPVVYASRPTRTPQEMLEETIDIFLSGIHV